ncbi:hypothetical protein Nepgr_005273 [Nepenthes gracilis]|uniref:Uncharacterized protein n=1 Tax=Nepenthes gracilis TaxID=150966 RepID=A0AAD3XG47_NEPGR|nr:hypothetical protein Nepgr_005273 [Nepenthes gracilis]
MPSHLVDSVPVQAAYAACSTVSVGDVSEDDGVPSGSMNDEHANVVITTDHPVLDVVAPCVGEHVAGSLPRPLTTLEGAPIEDDSRGRWVLSCPDLPLPCCSRAARVPEGPSFGNVAAVQGLSLCNPNDSPSCHLEPHALPFAVGRSCDASQYHLLYWFLVFLAMMHQQMLGLLVLDVDWSLLLLIGDGIQDGRWVVILLLMLRFMLPIASGVACFVPNGAALLLTWKWPANAPGVLAGLWNCHWNLLRGSCLERLLAPFCCVVKNGQFLLLRLLLADASLLMHIVKCSACCCVSCNLVSYIWLVLFDGAALQNQVMDVLAEFFDALICFFVSPLDR